MAEFNKFAHRGLHFQEMLEERFTCKRYDSAKQVSDEDFAKILEAARLSPSSFGFEPWKIVVLENQELVDGLRERAWGAKKNASKTCVILARRNLNVEDGYLDHILDDVKQADVEAKATRKQVFKDFQERDFKLLTQEDRFIWAQKQAYITLANMLNMAALIGVDSTPIEGFNRDALEAYLVEKGVFDPNEWGIAVLAQFGYATADHMEVTKTRRPVDEIVEYIK